VGTGGGGAKVDVAGPGKREGEEAEAPKKKRRVMLSKVQDE
jgi:hypothetical protein